ncbi:S1 family peptidase [Brevibacillus sp. TJ4]|uniref:S1 family peptidase n=1 Tax=Brevibacillus sp. TJ4 TaxID=3234853 RepID=UPI0037D31869
MKKLRKSTITTILYTALAITLSIQGTLTTAAQEYEPEALEYIKSKEAIQESERFRAEMGLSSSSRTLESLSNNPNNFSEKYGAFLTEEEESELDERIAEQKSRIPKIKDFIEENLKEEFASIYIDQKAGGVVNIGFKNDTEEQVERYVKDLKKMYSKDLINIYYTDYTEEQLNEIAESISESRKDLEKEGIDISSVSVNIPAQKINIGVLRKPSAARALLLDRGNDKISTLQDIDSSIINVFKEDLHEAQASPNDYYRPIQAGLRIENIETGGRCTSAFSAQIDLDFYVITAGHCVEDLRDRFRQGGSRFGRVADFQNGPRVDAAIIELDDGSDDASYYVFGNSKSKLFSIEDVQRTRDETIGDAVCISGYRTGTVKCGILKSTNWNGYVQAPNGDSVYLRGMRQATYSSLSGDSGAPIFLGGTAIGVHSTNGGIYTHISRIVDYFDIDDIFRGN